LSQLQKAQVLVEGGLPFARMTPAQQHVYREALFLTHAPLALLEAPPPFQFTQEVTPGEPGRKPSLGELAFLTPDGTRRTRIAAVYIPFPAKRPGAEDIERSE
jgi:hypothetical protein